MLTSSKQPPIHFQKCSNGLRLTRPFSQCFLPSRPQNTALRNRSNRCVWRSGEQPSARLSASTSDCSPSLNSVTNRLFSPLVSRSVVCSTGHSVPPNTLLRSFLDYENNLFGGEVPSPHSPLPVLWASLRREKLQSNLGGLRPPVPQSYGATPLAFRGFAPVSTGFASCCSVRAPSFLAPSLSILQTSFLGLTDVQTGAHQARSMRSFAPPRASPGSGFAGIGEVLREL